MLIRKLFRTAWRYKAQFLSMTLMVAIGVGVFLGFNIEWKSIEADTSAFFENTNYADFRLYSEMGFSEMDIEAIQKISGVNAATRFSLGERRGKGYKKIRSPDGVGGLYGFYYVNHSGAGIREKFGRHLAVGSVCREERYLHRGYHDPLLQGRRNKRARWPACAKAEKC